MNSTTLLRKYFGPLLAGILLLRIAAMTLWLAALIPARLDITFPEGQTVAPAYDVANGRPAYRDWRQWPHSFAPYAPLTYYPVGWAARAFSAAPSPRLVYLVGRTLAFASVLGIGAVIYLIGRSLALSRLWSLAAVGVFAHWRVLLEFGASCRPDAPRTFFALLALWLILRRPGGSWRTLLAALASLYVSLWIKPTAWAQAAAIAAWTWQRFGARRTLAIGAAFLAAGILPVLALDHHFHGLLLANMNATMNFPYTLDMVAAFYRPPVRWESLVIELGLALSLVQLWRMRPQGLARIGCSRQFVSVPEASDVSDSQSPARYFWLALALAVITDSLLMLKGGSDINYLYDAYALAAVAAAWLTARLWRRESILNAQSSISHSDNPQSEIRNPQLIGATGAGEGVRAPSDNPQSGAGEDARAPGHISHSAFREALLWLVIVPLTLWQALLYFPTLRDDVQRARLISQPPPILRMLAGARGPVLCTEAAVTLTSSGVNSILDLSLYGESVRRGLISDAPLLSSIREQRFEYIILSVQLLQVFGEGTPKERNLYSPGFMDSVRRYYEPIKVVGGFRVYAPKKASS